LQKIEEKIMQKCFWNDTKFRKNKEQIKFWRRNLEKRGKFTTDARGRGPGRGWSGELLAATHLVRLVPRRHRRWPPLVRAKSPVEVASRRGVDAATPSGCNPRQRRSPVKRAPRHRSPQAVAHREKRGSRGGARPPAAAPPVPTGSREQKEKVKNEERQRDPPTCIAGER
jgi:hypothetical protein